MKADGIILINTFMRTWHLSPKAVSSENKEKCDLMTRNWRWMKHWARKRVSKDEAKNRNQISSKLCKKPQE